MVKLVTLDKRLSLMASYMTPGGVGVDVGTDHGYLAVSLVESGRASFMTATDIRPGPLSSAEKCIRENNLEDRIRTVLTDGLNGLELSRVTDIFIGGMGGTLISEILLARLDELSGKNLILQPMTQASLLRRNLCENGIKLISERCAVAGGKVYSVMNAWFDGVVRECTPVFALIGRVPEDKSADADAYLLKVLKREEKILRGLERSESGNPIEISRLKSEISALQAMLDDRRADIFTEKEMK